MADLMTIVAGLLFNKEYKMKAKDTSHIGMIVGAVGLIATFVVVMVKFILHNTCPSVEDVKALILIGVAPSIPFCPIFISTWFDKIIELKNGKEIDYVEDEQTEM